MIRTIPFEPWHIEAVLVDKKENFEGDVGLADRMLAFSKSPTSCMQTIVDDKSPVTILAIIGLFIYWPGVAEAFTLMSKKIRLFPIAVTKEVKRVMDFYFKQLKLRRLQTYVREGFAVEYNWALFLGFRREALMKNWGPEGDSYYLLARYGESA